MSKQAKRSSSVETYTPRLRMFAGPNGSGKSTLKSVLPPALLGVYLNADEMERKIRELKFLDLRAYRVTHATEVLDFFIHSPLLAEKGLTREAEQLRYHDGRLIFTGVSMNGYYASVAGEFIRQKLLDSKSTFTFETVMSHQTKVALLKQAQQSGYRTYLYYVATEDPEINIARVLNRVAQGGHAVPEEKIRSRYYRSLDLLKDAIRYSNRAYIWDNSSEGKESTHFAEITEGRELVWKSDLRPAWFKRAVLDKIPSS